MNLSSADHKHLKFCIYYPLQGNPSELPGEIFQKYRFLGLNHLVINSIDLEWNMGICIFSKAFPVNLKIWEISTLMSSALIKEEKTMWDNVQHMEIRGLISGVVRENIGCLVKFEFGK